MTQKETPCEILRDIINKQTIEITGEEFVALQEMLKEISDGLTNMESCGWGNKYKRCDDKTWQHMDFVAKQFLYATNKVMTRLQPSDTHKLIIQEMIKKTVGDNELV